VLRARNPGLTIGHELCRPAERIDRNAKGPCTIDRPAAEFDPEVFSMDALSELLRVVKLSGAMFYKSSCTAPWCFDAPPSSAFLPYVKADATHVIEFHHIS
jgi:hypothetical protein